MLQRIVRLIVLAALFIFPLFFARLVPPPPPTAGGSGTTGSSTSMHKSLLKFVDEGGTIGYITIGVGLIGIFIWLEQCVVLATESRRSGRLANVPIKKENVSRVMELSHAADARGSWLSQALRSMDHVYQSTGSIDNSEVLVFTKSLEDKFGSFRARIEFMSDTAGALGLLGTIWGMYTTFIAKNVDREAVTSGMALALVTTYIGIIVSVTLNFLCTEVIAWFNRRLHAILERTDEFRAALLDRRSA